MTYPQISTTTKLEIFDIIETCANIKTKTEFENVFKKINSLFGQEMIAYGIGDIRTKHVISNLNAGFSADFMTEIIEKSGRMKSPLFKLWLKNRTPQVLDFSDEKKLSALDTLTPYLDFSLQNIMSHGMMDRNQQYISYFGIAKIPEKIGTHHIMLLEILAPHLHVAYSQFIEIKKPLFSSMDLLHTDSNNADSRASTKALSIREHEVLCWLSEGKTNWDISQILHISENTEKIHLRNILKKLKANNRHHAVAIAFRTGLLNL